MKLEFKVWDGTDEVIFFSIQALCFRSFITCKSALCTNIKVKGEIPKDIQSLEHLSVFTFSSRLKRHLQNLKSAALFVELSIFMISL